MKEHVVSLVLWIDKDFHLPVRAMKDIVENMSCKCKEHFDGIFTQHGLTVVRVTRSKTIRKEGRDK